MKKATPHHGLFITFEGIDGCGKTTQVRRVEKYLKKCGHRVQILREPGSTRLAERIRKVLLDRRNHMTAVTELMLYEAARAELVAVEIAPLLKQGVIVLCDRFYDSTTAYQGYGRRLDIGMVKRLHTVAVGTCRPDLTLVLDLPVEAAMRRRGGQPDRLESQSQAFHKRVRSGFREIARTESRRVKLIDARASVDEVFEQVVRHLERKLLR